MVFYMYLFKHKSAYDMRISDWSSDVCSSDLVALFDFRRQGQAVVAQECAGQRRLGASTSPTDALQFFISAPHELVDIAGNNVIAIEPHVGKMLVDRGVKVDQPRVSERLPLASHGEQADAGRDRESVVQGESGSVRVNLGG